MGQDETSTAHPVECLVNITWMFRPETSSDKFNVLREMALSRISPCFCCVTTTRVRARRIATEQLNVVQAVDNIPYDQEWCPKDRQGIGGTGACAGMMQLDSRTSERRHATKCGVRMGTCRMSTLSCGVGLLHVPAAVARGLHADLKQTQTTCAPCPPHFPGGAHLSASTTSLNMSGFLNKVKKKAKGVVDSLRPSSRQGRSSTSASPHASGHSTPNIGTDPPTTQPLQSQSTTTAPLSSSVRSVTQPHAPNSAQPVALPSPPAHATPTYARLSAPPSALATTGSVIHDLLTTIRDASDMCLPLKAAVVGVLKIWDVCEVGSFAADVLHQIHSHLIAHRTAQSRIYRA